MTPQSRSDRPPQLAALARKTTGWPMKGLCTPEDATNWRAYWSECATAGLLSEAMPRAYAGQAKTTQETIETMTQFGAMCQDTGFAMGLNSQIWTVQEPINKFGTKEQRSDYLPRLAKGDIIGAFALTEPEAGSDALALKTTAKRDGDVYRLNGTKHYVGMGPCCDVALVFASTAPEKKSWGLSVFLVEKEDKGLQQGPEQKKIGLTTLPMGEMHFHDCVIPASRRLGPEGAGASIFQATMDWERSFLFATQVGAMERQLDDCVMFSKDRKVFERPIHEFQSVSNRIANMALRLQACKLMLREAARLKDEGQLTTEFAAMTKLQISESFLDSSVDAMRIHGGAGYLEGSMPGADVRDALGGVIYSGTSDVQRNMIARLQLRRGARSQD